MDRKEQPIHAIEAHRHIIIAVLIVALTCSGVLAWSITRGARHFARERPTVTLLPQGELLVVGGFASPVWLGGLRDPKGESSATAERYDPATGRWRAAGTMATPRLRHTATLLLDGRVLVVGGVTTLGDSTEMALAAAELYDPGDNTWQPGASLDAPRYGHTATLLADGRVLVVGGRGYATGAGTAASVYDPVIDRWQQTAAMEHDRTDHTATLLADGRVLVIGGRTDENYTDKTAEIYDPASNTWGVASALSTGRRNHTATLRSDGRVLVAGGTGATGTLVSSEWYDPARNSWTAGSSLNTPRTDHTATLLANGTVLLIGGDGTTTQRATTEWYDPASDSWRTGQELRLPWYQHAAILLPTGTIVVAGGGMMREMIERYAVVSGFPATPHTSADYGVVAVLLAR